MSINGYSVYLKGFIVETIEEKSALTKPWYEAIDINVQAEKFGTPLYLFSEKKFEENFSEFLKFTGHPSRIAYPVKANPMVEILRLHGKLGGAADCSSPNEYRLARLAGFEDHNIIYNTPAPDLAFAEELLQRGASVVIDSVTMYHHLNESKKRQFFTGNIFLRINPEIKIQYQESKDYQELTSHAGSRSKFGIEVEKISSLLKKNTLPITGLYIHIGTQIDTIDAFENALLYMHALATEVVAAPNCSIKIINIGGGLGMPLTRNEQMPCREEYVTRLLPLKDDRYYYMIEPGHALVGDTMGIITTIKAIKEIWNKQCAITDVGTDQLAKVTILKWPHDILDADFNFLPLERNDSVGGPLCFNGDTTLLHHTSVSNLQEGHRLFITNCGAYCYSSVNHFNGQTLSGIASLLKSGNVILCHEKEKLFFDSNLLTYNWNSIDLEGANKQLLDKEIIRKLSSLYLREQINHDQYEVITLAKLDADNYLAEIMLHSEIKYLSAPFMLRALGDLAIIATLHRQGKKEKDVNVLADCMTIEMPDMMESNKHYRVQVSLSSVYLAKDFRYKKLIADCTLTDYDARIKFSLNFMDGY